MRKIIYMILISFLLLCTAALAEEAAQLPIVFNHHGGGQYIYCNSPEFYTEKQLSTIENPESAYAMKNPGLKPDNYSVFFCQYNNTSFDTEADIEFRATGSAVITIHSVGFHVMSAWFDEDCLDVWADSLNIRIRDLVRPLEYVPFSGDKGLPATIYLDNSSDWLSNYIYNYDLIRPLATFNIVVDFTIESGEVDVNFANLKSYGKIGDRSMHNSNATAGTHDKFNFSKGITKDTLPMVEADLNVEISSDTVNGENVPVAIYNQFVDGHISPKWMTNIGITGDAYMESKWIAAGSDMLSFEYAHDSKLAYYGKNVPMDQRDNIWVKGMYNNCTFAWESGMPGSADSYIPNAPTAAKLDINSPPNPKWEFSLGNCGVIYRYHLSLENTDIVPRTVNYFLLASLSNNIVMVRDEYENLLNPYTLSVEDAFAISKGSTGEKTDTCMFSAWVQPDETKEYIVDVILPTNVLGGTVNYLTVDNRKHLEDTATTDFPVYSEMSAHKNVFWDGQNNMKWEGGELYRESAGVWSEVSLPDSAKEIFGSKSGFVFVKTGHGHAARYGYADNFSPYFQRISNEKYVYFFDNRFEYIDRIELPHYVVSLTYDGDDLYAVADRIYIYVDGEGFIPLDYNLPIVAGGYALAQVDGEVYAKIQKGQYVKIAFESPKANYSIDGCGEVFVDKKSWKVSNKDLDTKNILSVSFNGLDWVDIEFPNRLLPIENICYIGDQLIVGCKYESFVFDIMPTPNTIRVCLNGEMLAFDVPPRVIEGRTMVPLRFFFEKLGASVTWIGETQEIIVERQGIVLEFQIGSNTAIKNGEKLELDVPPYIENDKTLMPARFLGENLGYDVSWDEQANIAFISVLMNAE